MPGIFLRPVKPDPLGEEQDINCQVVLVIGPEMRNTSLDKALQSLFLISWGGSPGSLSKLYAYQEADFNIEAFRTWEILLPRLCGGGTAREQGSGHVWCPIQEASARCGVCFSFSFGSQLKFRNLWHFYCFIRHTPWVTSEKSKGNNKLSQALLRWIYY